MDFSRSFCDESGSPLMKGPPKNRQRRNRTYFSDDALDRLETVFNENPYPDIVQREALGVECGVSEARIQVWFQNRRSRNRRTKTKKTPKASPSSSASSSSSLSLSSSSSSPSPIKVTPLKPKPVASTVPNTGFQPPMLSPYAYPYMYNPMLMSSLYPLMPVSNMSTQMSGSPLWSPVSSQMNRVFEFPVPYSPTQAQLFMNRFSYPLTPETSPSISGSPTYLPFPPTSLNTIATSSPVTSATSKSKGVNREEEIDVVTPLTR